MSVEYAPGSAPSESREGLFSHAEVGHQVEDAIVRDWEERGLPISRASVEQDEQGSFRSNEGYDLLLSNIPIDLTMSSEKELARSRWLDQGLLKSGEKVVVRIPVGDKEFRGKTIDEILADPELTQRLSEATLRNVLRTLPAKDAAQLLARLQARVLTKSA
jgi:hypothetical protein